MKNRELIRKITVENDIRDNIYQLLTINPFAIQAIKSSYLDDDMWRYAIDLEPSVFQFIDTYKKVPSTKLCMYAVKADGNNIRYIHPSRITDYMMDIAHQTCPTAHLYVKRGNEDKREKVESRVRDEFQTSMEDKMNNTILNQLRNNPNLIREIENPTDEMIGVAIIANPDVVLYFDELSSFMVQLLEEYYPDIAPLYPNYNAYYRQHHSY